MTLRRKDNSHLLTGRISLGRSSDAQAGFSVLYGRVLESEEMSLIPAAKLLSDKTVLKRLLGLDAQYTIGPYAFMAEVNWGKHAGRDVGGGLARAEYTLPFFQALTMQAQADAWSQNLRQGDSTHVLAAAGATYRLNSSMTIRAAYFHDIENPNGRDDRKVLIQFYYYGL
jgi:hypothetical protein